ncbi:MAG: tetratricopeptide repeat protein [Bacteroidaceae bacterium]|nr:tetratricopeptide repeat protein [Bacteroidaceae bacterium]
MTDTERRTKAEDYYQKGNAYRKQSDWQHALECYNHAIELDPTSPAVRAKEMLDNILNYYCKEMFNP